MSQSDASIVCTILAAISASAVSLAIVAWLVRSIINHWLSKDIEVFKATLQHEKNTEIEKLRSDLGRMALEHEVKFNQLHNKVFVIIARLYKLIVLTQRTMKGYFEPLDPRIAPSEDERFTVAFTAWSNLNTFFMDHEIYFDKHTCEALQNYLLELRLLFVDFQAKKYATNNKPGWEQLWANLNTNADNLKRNLEDVFRKKIGVEP